MAGNAPSEADPLAGASEPAEVEEQPVRRRSAAVALATPIRERRMERPFVGRGRGVPVEPTGARVAPTKDSLN
jgi:hypothetical protein